MCFNGALKYAHVMYSYFETSSLVNILSKSSLTDSFEFI